MRNDINASMVVWFGQPLNGILLLAVKGQNQQQQQQRWMSGSTEIRNWTRPLKVQIEFWSIGMGGKLCNTG